MSQESEQTIERADQKQEARGRRIAKRVGVGAVLLVTAFVVIMMVLYPRPENALGLGGTLKITADPDVDVYIGDKHIGTGSVELAWDELLGTAELQLLTKPVTRDVPSPSVEGMGAITAEALAGEGSQIVWKKNGMTVIRPLPIACKHILLRRQNGDLDLVSVIDVEFSARNHRSRFLVLIRLRSTKEGSTDLPCGQVETWRIGPKNKSLHGIVRTAPTPPPDEFADEIAEKGLWKPKG